MNYTKELYDRLTKYRNTLYNACYLDYVRLTSLKDKEELSAIYKEQFKKETGILLGCSRCLLRDCKTLGKLYFEDEKVYKQLAEEAKKKKEKEEEKKKEEIKKKEEVKNESKTKRKGRPKKSN